MKKLALTLLATTVIGFSAYAEAPVTKALVVNQQVVLEKSTAAIELKKDMEKKRKEFQEELAKFEKDLREKEQQLAAQQSKLSEAEFAKKREDFEKRIIEVQGRLELRRAQLEEGYNAASQQIFQAMVKAAEHVKNEEKASLFINMEQVLAADASLDMSDRIVAKMNKDLPNVKVSFKSDAEIKKMMSK